MLPFGHVTSWDTAALLPHANTKTVVSLLAHGLSFAGHVFRAAWGQNTALGR